MKLDKHGNYEQTPDNIAEMLKYLADNADWLEPHQCEFIASVRGQYKATGTMSPKQFHWIRAYYSDLSTSLAGGGIGEFEELF